MLKMRNLLIYKKLIEKCKYMTIEEVQEDLLNYSYRNKILPPGIGDNYSSDNIGIKVKLEGGFVEMPFRYDWFARMVEFYGLTSAVNYSQMIVRKWLELR